jgi:hypothetical protein
MGAKLTNVGDMAIDVPNRRTLLPPLGVGALVEGFLGTVAHCSVSRKLRILSLETPTLTHHQ